MSAVMTTSAADHIFGLRIGKKSMKNYTSKMKTINSFIQSKYSKELGVDMFVPLDHEVIKDLFGWLITNTSLTVRGLRVANEVLEQSTADVNQDDVFAQSSATMSTSGMQGFKSALLWFYKENNAVMDPNTNAWIDTFIKGYKKSIAEKKSRGIMKIKEGKSPLSFQGYNTVCETFMTLKPQGRRFTFQESIFGWTYTTLSWNTMGRSHSVGGIMFEHITWKDDCLLVTFPNSKCDQTGEGLSNDKHIYSNPLNPKICPILSLGVLVFTTYRSSDVESHKIFGSKDPEARFTKVLRNILELIPEEKNLGAPRKDLGSHSQRKGSITYVLGFSFLSAVQVYLRAGWSIGNVQDRYIFGGAGGDQLVGRTVSGLPVNCIDFSILPPHFSQDDLDLLNEIGWSNILPGYEHYPQSFQIVVPWLLASLVHHSEWLEQNLSDQHPIFHQPFRTKCFDQLGMTDICTFFRGKILLGINFCDRTSLQASGIPDNIAIAHEVRTLRGTVARFEDIVLPTLKDDIISTVTQMPETIKTALWKISPLKVFILLTCQIFNA